jgi:hypothetical protein
MDNAMGQASRWPLLNNLYGYPTDTPICEKYGWTGDTALMVPFGGLDFHLARFLAKWTDDIADAQQPNGSIPLIIPVDGHVPPTVASRPVTGMGQRLYHGDVDAVGQLRRQGRGRPALPRPDEVCGLRDQCPRRRRAGPHILR